MNDLTKKEIKEKIRNLEDHMELCEEVIRIIKDLNYTYPLIPMISDQKHPDVDYVLYLLKKTIKALKDISDVMNITLKAKMPIWTGETKE